MQVSCGQREQKEREIIGLCDGFGHSPNKWKVINIWVFYWEKWGVRNHERYDHNYALVKLLRLQSEEL